MGLGARLRLRVRVRARVRVSGWVRVGVSGWPSQPVDELRAQCAANEIDGVRGIVFVVQSNVQPPQVRVRVRVRARVRVRV